MNQHEQGRESVESIDQTGDAHEQDPETTSTQGEVAGGDETDVPGGAYNVPPAVTEEVSDDSSRSDGSSQ